MVALLPDGLPSAAVLQAEGIAVRTHAPDARAAAPDLVVGILNLMPDKIATETQLIRMLADGPRRVEIILFTTDAYMARVQAPDYSSANTPTAHMRRYYRGFAGIRATQIDGLIITGAPVEQTPFEAVPYWPELLEVFAWAEARGIGVFNICWAAQAALQHYHGVPKHVLERKLFGVFAHHVERGGGLLEGIAADFRMPVSRYSEIHRAELPDSPDLHVLAASPEAGLGLLADTRLRHHYVFNHFEYDEDTLKREYDRDRAAGAPIALPKNYFPDNDPSAAPQMDWRRNGRRVYQNWLGLIADKRAPAASA